MGVWCNLRISFAEIELFYCLSFYSWLFSFLQTSCFGEDKCLSFHSPHAGVMVKKKENNKRLLDSREVLFWLLEDVSSLNCFSFHRCLFAIYFHEGFFSTTTSKHHSGRSWGQGEISLWSVLIQWHSFIYVASDYQVNYLSASSYI